MLRPRIKDMKYSKFNIQIGPFSVTKSFGSDYPVDTFSHLFFQSLSTVSHQIPSLCPQNVWVDFVYVATVTDLLQRNPGILASESFYGNNPVEVNSFFFFNIFLL